MSSLRVPCELAEVWHTTGHLVANEQAMKSSWNEAGSMGHLVASDEATKSSNLFHIIPNPLYICGSLNMLKLKQMFILMIRITVVDETSYFKNMSFF